MRIGIYSFAHTHAFGYIRALLKDMHVEILASDPDYKSRPDGEMGGPQAAAQLGVSYVDTLDELLDRNPDGVIVCTENTKHREIVEILASRGVNILCEKPLATTLEDADAMIAAAANAGVILMVAYPVRFSRPFTALKAVVDSGGLGDLRAITGANNGQLPTDRQWFSDPELSGGGAIMDHTVHIADMLDTLMPDASAVSVYARANKIIHGNRAKAETSGLVSVEYDNGVVVTIDCSWCMPDHNPVWGGLKLQVYGTSGNAAMDAFDSQRVDGFSETQSAPLRLNYGMDSNALMLEAFVNAVRTRETVQPDGESGRRSLAIALAAYDSLKVGQPVLIA